MFREYRLILVDSSNQTTSQCEDDLKIDGDVYYENYEGIQIDPNGIKKEILINPKLRLLDQFVELCNVMTLLI